MRHQQQPEPGSIDACSTQNRKISSSPVKPEVGAAREGFWEKTSHRQQLGQVWESCHLATFHSDCYTSGKSERVKAPVYTAQENYFKYSVVGKMKIEESKNVSERVYCILQS